MAATRVAAAATSAPVRSASFFTVTRIRVLTVLVCWAAWESVALSGLLYRDVVPSSINVIIATYHELLDSEFYKHLGITFAEVFVGFIWGGAVGIALGIVLGANAYLRRAMEPYLNAIGSTPKIIFLPIIFLMFGVGIESKMAKGALSAFFPTVFSTMLGMMIMNPVFARVGKSFNLDRWQMVAKVYMPAMVSPVIVGLRLGMGVTVIGILVAEIKFSAGGLGFRLMEYYDQFKIAPMYAMLIIIFGLAAFANWGMTRVQARYDWTNYGTKGRRTSGLAVPH
jgi:ABC-type nitrate/sulfonate/bicarbonate transport system permease component